MSTAREAPDASDSPLLPEQHAGPKAHPLNVCKWQRASQIKLFVFLLVVAGIIVAVAVFRVQTRFGDLLQWLQDNKLAGSLIFVGIYAVGTVLFVPGLILTLGAGFVFRMWLGLLVVWVGASFGLMAAFLVGRYLLRDWVAAKAAQNAKFHAIDQALEIDGWKILLLLRLAPIVPFTALNYVISLTRVKFSHYSATSIIGIIPGTALYVYFGSLAGTIADVSNGDAGPSVTTQIVIAVVSGVLIIAAVVASTVVAKRAIARSLGRVREQEQRTNAAELDASSSGVRGS